MESQILEAFVIVGDFQKEIFFFSLHFPIMQFSYKVLEDKKKRMRVCQVLVREISQNSVLGSRDKQRP